MLPSERLKGIEAFAVAAETGSFTEAAKRLNLTVSAISKSVARLEARLGIRLLERTTRRLKLTDAGAAFYATCTRVLADLADAEAALASHGTEPVGRINIDVPVSFGRRRVLPLILDFAERFPAVRPHVTFTDRFVDLFEEGVDVGIRISATGTWPEGLARHYVGSEKVVFCAAPAFLARHGAPADVGDMLALDGVLFTRADGALQPWRIERPGGVEFRTGTPRMVLGSGEGQVEAVKAGMGIAQLATWLIADDLARGDLVEVLPGSATAGLPLHIVWPESRQRSPKVNALITHLKAHLSID